MTIRAFFQLRNNIFIITQFSVGPCKKAVKPGGPGTTNLEPLIYAQHTQYFDVQESLKYLYEMYATLIIYIYAIIDIKYSNKSNLRSN